MNASAQEISSPQARGRELARQGRSLWLAHGTVKAAAAQLMSAHQDLPCLQAFRYSASLSQDQAAERYNEVTGHQTCLGGTTINAWESWARKTGGSPPPFSGLLVLAAGYGRGPLGAGEEPLTPADLVADCYERLPPEDQIALRAFSDAHRGQAVAAAPRPAPASAQAGKDFSLIVPTVEFGNPQIPVFTLPSTRPGQLLDLGWEVFGHGIERLIRQIKDMGVRLKADMCFGINEAGLVMATFLASAQFARCPIGYLRCVKTRQEVTLDPVSFYPPSRVQAPVIVVCDFEVKQADVAGFIARQLRDRYPGAELYFAVFGAMTKNADLEVGSFDDLTGADVMRDAGFAGVFIAATMNPPGIEPPLELR